MFTTSQLQPRPTTAIPKDKTRTFGDDLTQLYNNTNRDNGCNQYISLGGFKNSHNCDTKDKASTPSSTMEQQESPYSQKCPFILSQISSNPLTHHIADILHYTLSQSHMTTIEQDYMRWHSQINQQMRQILISWLIRLQVQFKLSNSTLSLAVYLIDKYCYQQSIIRSKYQLLGITCLFMAAKYEQLLTPRIHRFIQACQGLYLRRDLVQMQAQILDCIGFNVNKIVLVRQILMNRLDEVLTNIIQSNSMTMQQFQSQSHQQIKQSLTRRCEYMLELILLQYRLNLIQPNYVSAIVIYMCCKIDGHTAINSKYVIEKYALDEKQFKQYFHLFIALVKRKGQIKFRDVNKKYFYTGCTNF